ncbi:phenol 2-monooxygenase [Atractiella rhizophila]|nr:phenol 2-monooxygenase [Atractiella rhizophila]
MQPPSKVDVLVVGAGPAGLMASLCLTTYNFSVLHIDDRPEPTSSGRADGIQPRTIEVLRNIGSVAPEDEPGEVASGRAPLKGGGLAKELISQGVRVYEVSFWDPTEKEELARTSRAPSCPDFVDVEDNYTLLLHQGRIERAFMREIDCRRARLSPASSYPTPPGGVFRSFAIQSTSTDSHPTHPCLSNIKHVPSGTTYAIRSKYVLGCDGAKSTVRKCIAGGGEGDGEWKGKIRMEGEATDIVWGVMDAAVVSDFPDLKCKNLIHSRKEGSIMTIPREANLCRFYVQLQSEDGKHYDRNLATKEVIMERAKKIFSPYKIEFGYIDWFSVYQIGQRIASRYTLDERIFVGGDATHTHSPKAGQGMNVSFLDMYDLCWKINLVEKGLASRSLLKLYEHERRHVAQQLLKFDAEYSRLFSGRSPVSDNLTSSTDPSVSPGTAAPAPESKAASHAERKAKVDAQRFIELFKQNAFFTSGCGAVYEDNSLNALPGGEVVRRAGPTLGRLFNPSGCTLKPGERLLPAKVTRAIDANQVRLQQEVKMNGAFRIHFFLGDLLRSNPSKVDAVGKWLRSPNSFLSLYRSKDGVQSSIVDGLKGSKSSLEVVTMAQNESQYINPFFTFLTILSTPRYDFEISSLPLPLRYFADQVYGDDFGDRRVEGEKEGTVHRKYGFDERVGAVVVVRPDGYVGAVVALEEGWGDAVNTYFEGFLKRWDEKETREGEENVKGWAKL